MTLPDGGLIDGEKSAVLICEALAVLCPHCGEAQPNRKGSEMWTVDDLQIEHAKLDGESCMCVSCDQSFKLTIQKSAKIQ